MPPRSRSASPVPALPARAIALATLALAALALAPRAAEAQVVQGTVRDAATGQPLAGVTVVAVDGRDSVVAGPAHTDPLGHFSLGAHHNGWLRVVARKLGYRPSVSDSLLFDMQDVVRFDVLMSESAALLDAVVVTERHRITAGEMMQVEGYDWRREREKASGYFYSGEALQEIGVTDALQLFDGVAPFVQMTQSQGVAVVKGVPVGRNSGCEPTVFVNGFLRARDAEPWNQLASIPAQFIHGVEFYYGKLRIPEVFRAQDPHACAVVAVWYRRGDPSRRPPQ